MMSFKASFACFLLLFLGFIFSSSASRDSTWMKSGIVVQETDIQHEIDMTGHGESMESDGPTTRRMDLESMDYGGPGANERHNPPSPGGL